VRSILLVILLAAGCARSAPEESRPRCAGASAPLGSIEDYRLTVRTRPNPLGFVVIRSTPLFGGADDASNALGRAAVGATFAALGPLKNPDHGNAVAYAVVVHDDGVVCRGYVSGNLVEVE
jgi:hypothetical protein